MVVWGEKRRKRKDKIKRQFQKRKSRFLANRKWLFVLGEKIKGRKGMWTKCTKYCWRNIKLDAGDCMAEDQREQGSV